MRRHGRGRSGADVPITCGDRFREFGLRILAGGASFLVLAFCPFCGARLPSSMRDQWFDRLEELGLEPEDDLPDALSSGE